MLQRSGSYTTITDGISAYITRNCANIGKMKPSILSQILELSLAERLRLAQDLWETVVDLPELGELTDLQRQELDRRLESLDRDPDQGIPWQQVLDDIRAGR